MFHVHCMPVILSKLHWGCVSGICSTGTSCELTSLCSYFMMFVEDMQQKPLKWHLEFFLSLQQCSGFSAVYVQEFLTNSAMSVFLHPMYSPDPASCDLFIFLKLRLPLKVGTAVTSAQFKRNCRLNLQTSRGYYQMISTVEQLLGLLYRVARGCFEGNRMG